MATESKIQSPGPNNEDLAQNDDPISLNEASSQMLYRLIALPLPHSSLTLPPSVSFFPLLSILFFIQHFSPLTY